jgi:hypothetical protein
MLTTKLDASGFVKSLVLAVGLTLLALIPQYLGIVGWLVALVGSLILISKTLGQTIVGSFLFLLVLGLAQYFVELAILKFR